MIPLKIEVFYLGRAEFWIIWFREMKEFRSFSSTDFLFKIFYLIIPSVAWHVVRFIF